LFRIKFFSRVRFKILGITRS